MNELRVYQKSATLKTANATYKMTAETGTALKHIFEVVEVSENTSFALAIMCAKVRSEKMYKNILDEAGNPVCDTFGDFAEKILGMSKAFASLHASVGEVFADEIANNTPWKYTPLEELLKLRKKLDTDGNPAFDSGKDILEFCEVSGITPKSTVKEIRGFIDAVLHEETPAEENTEGESAPEGESDTEGESDGEGETETENAEENPADKVAELIARLSVYTTNKASQGMLAKLAGYLTKMYKE